MDKQIIDAFLGAMIQSREGVSDLLFTVGKPPVIETHGWLEDLLKKLKGESFEMPSGLQIKTTPDKRATAIS